MSSFRRSQAKYVKQTRATRSRIYTCYAKEDGDDVTEYVAIRCLPERAGLVTTRCEASGTMYPGSFWAAASTARKMQSLEASSGAGARHRRYDEHM